MQQSLNGVRLLPSDTVAFTNPLGRVVDANMWYAVTARGARESYLRLTLPHGTGENSQTLVVL